MPRPQNEGDRARVHDRQQRPESFGVDDDRQGPPLGRPWARILPKQSQPP